MAPTNQTIAITTDADIIAARQAVRQLAVQLGFGGMDQSRIATAVSELARNVLRYATGGRGEVRIGQINDASARVGIEVVVADSGPGIPDVERAMQQGYSSGKGLGLGLSGTKRLMDEMVLQSELGVGTTVTIRKWLP